MHGEDLLALLGVGQVHEEDLVEASLARHLGRQLADVVGRRHHEDGRLAVLQPGEQTRLERPASASPPGLYERPFSSSSIISTHGAICSAIRSALSRFFSVSPMYLS